MQSSSAPAAGEANRLSDPRHLPQGSVVMGKWERMLGRHPPLAAPPPPTAGQQAVWAGLILRKEGSVCVAGNSIF